MKSCSKTLSAIAAVAALGAFGGVAWAGPALPTGVTETQAQAIALKETGGGTIHVVTYATVSGHKVYEFTIAVPHKANSEKVTVSEATGKVLSVTDAGPQNK